MATKYCEYCLTSCDAAHHKCPNCCAPLSSKVMPDENSLKETITAAVNSGIKSFAQPQNFNHTYSSSYGASQPAYKNGSNNALESGVYTCNKIITLILLLFAGFFGVHKFYEGKTVMGVLYIFTGGLFFVGLVVDFLALLSKPATYPRKS